ncbi:MAG: TIGR03546 family protein [Planctomycetota bacterium]
MIVIKFLRSLYKSLSGEATPHQIALGFVLGAALGLIPWRAPDVETAVLGKNLLWFAVLAALLVLRCRLSAATLGYVVYGGLAIAVTSAIGELGRFLIERALPQAWFVWLGTGPLKGFQLHTYWVCGAFIAALVNAIIAYPLVHLGVRRYRERMVTRMESSKLLRTLRKIWLFRVLKWVFVGGVSLTRE